MNGETTLSTIPKPPKVVKPVKKAARSKIDWEEIRHKVLESSARLVWVDEVPQEELEQAWAKRALQVAQVIDQGETGAQIQVAVIRLGHEIYGIEADYIYDIRTLNRITRVPRVPAWVAGLVNMRGRIISVLDLSRFLGLPTNGNNAAFEMGSHHLMVVGIPAMELALLVDEVLEIKSLPIGQIHDASSTANGIRSEYVRGVFVQHAADASDKNQKELIIVLDLPSLLSDKRLVVHEDIV
jgi:purine-binding chemotaxis protein CheW